MKKRLNIVKRKGLVFLILLFTSSLVVEAQSVARQWNEALLQCIREDFARPTVHARNLFYVSVAMYDAWAAYDNEARTYFLGKTNNGYTCPYSGIPEISDVEFAREEAMSYAAYRLILHRFNNSPGKNAMLIRVNLLMAQLGYDINYNSLDYTSGKPAALGNYIATLWINYGLQDGANEKYGYINRYYAPINPPLLPHHPGNDTLLHPNRWQPLTLDTFIDQSGHVLPGKTPEFLSPEWGEVYPFALSDSILTTYTRDSYDYKVYHDPGTPPMLDTNKVGGLSEEYKWGFSLVAIWSGHLDSRDTTELDISPAGLGNISSYPTNFPDMRQFYDLENGGDNSKGRAVNPSTGVSYPSQIVKRADYARVLAEFWADGPDSETPPGHWFTILNHINDDVNLVKKFEGEGEIMDDLEWDIKSYFTLAGAMHDAAITAWGIKGWYDYIRPVSAIRYMAGKGQSSDTNLPSFHPAGIHLVPGWIELVQLGDTLAGSSNQHVGKIKLYGWRGPSYINDPDTDEAHAGWILAENWWPYQRPSFITPPFAGYISGHSTYSRAAAEVLTFFTGSEYFPGGVGEFVAEKNKFLVFEEGPSEDIKLQWATYRDASDQCSLSRIWGGIHPPADDIPGRLIGMEIGKNTFEKAKSYFSGKGVGVQSYATLNTLTIYPNPVNGDEVYIRSEVKGEEQVLQCFDLSGRLIKEKRIFLNEVGQVASMDVSELKKGIYLLQFKDSKSTVSKKLIRN